MMKGYGLLPWSLQSVGRKIYWGSNKVDVVTAGYETWDRQELIESGVAFQRRQSSGWESDGWGRVCHQLELAGTESLFFSSFHEKYTSNHESKKIVLLYMATNIFSSCWEQRKEWGKLIHGQKVVPKAMLEVTKQVIYQQPEVCSTDFFTPHVGAQTS